ncbi:MoxR family ATPase [Colwellia sp. Arc7-635]|uniref:AAA family ATPase n=1 Tax=Colwellia sp. Arc7-635 TaxID=2497879 RepID=UPI000F84F01F|nr:MoxR family ATPase [Colwellia sp. Arc7-635]AZQ84195.1 MoxR family ATPase [Colwellia sp. Arc7-635]
MQEQQITVLLNKLSQVSDEIAKVIVGQQAIIDELLISILAGGHCLLEGVPGLAKTLMVSSLAKTLALDFNRVQFTPDLMPSDIVGTEILETDHESGERFFKFQKGPVFTNILLADEINRTPPKTQAALLEAMQERRISYAGTTYDLPKPFFVLATQNPVEQAGTYPLPEAQLDRFLMFVRVGYPTEQEEIEILKRTTGNNHSELNAILTAEDIIALQDLVRSVTVSDELLTYAASLARATRPDNHANTDSNAAKTTSNDKAKAGCQSVIEHVRWGAGPRAGQALILCAKARALMSGRYAISLADIQFVAPAVLRHRILVNFQAEALNISPDNVIEDLLEFVPVPTSPLQ